MEKYQLEELVVSLSTREIASKLQISQTTVRYWLKKHSLATNFDQRSGGRRGGSRKSKVLQAGLKYKCEKCGEGNPDNFYKARNRCKKCHNKNQVELFRSYKRKAVEYMGGKCSICGYNKCQGALGFHHLNQKEKDPKWKTMRNWTFENMKLELSKCILVCGNCHAEIHYTYET